MDIITLWLCSFPLLTFFCTLLSFIGFDVLLMVTVFGFAIQVDHTGFTVFLLCVGTVAYYTFAVTRKAVSLFRGVWLVWGLILLVGISNAFPKLRAGALDFMSFKLSGALKIGQFAASFHIESISELILDVCRICLDVSGYCLSAGFPEFTRALCTPPVGELDVCLYTRNPGRVWAPFTCLPPAREVTYYEYFASYLTVWGEEPPKDPDSWLAWFVDAALDLAVRVLNHYVSRYDLLSVCSGGDQPARV